MRAQVCVYVFVCERVKVYSEFACAKLAVQIECVVCATCYHREKEKTTY